MNEQRRYPRATPTTRTAVFDAVTGDELGTLGNHSSNGLMIVARSPIEEDLLLQVRFTLHDGEGQERSLTVGVESLWCAPAQQADRYFVGFEIVEIAEDDQAFLTAASAGGD